jgi:hypothetical protein
VRGAFLYTLAFHYENGDSGSLVLSRRLMLIAALCITGAPATLAGTIFSDDFNDGDVSDWTKTTNYGGTTSVTARSDSFVSPGFSLETFLLAPPGGTSLTVDASHGFTAPAAGDYTLTL